MEFIKSENLTLEEQLVIEKTFEAAQHSVSKKGHRVGCAILCENKKIYTGSVNERTLAIGSTCAERMAVDQLYFHGREKPKLCGLVGFFVRKGWTRNYICTPCGVCLEMFFEMVLDFAIKDLDFLCATWDKSKFLRIKLSELYPQIGKGEWSRFQT